jgi:hypothetical protein
VSVHRVPGGGSPFFFYTINILHQYLLPFTTRSAFFPRVACPLTIHFPPPVQRVQRDPQVLSLTQPWVRRGATSTPKETS